MSSFAPFLAQAGYLPPQQGSEDQRLVGYFTSLVVSGSADIDIRTGSQQSALTLTGDPKDLQHVIVTEKNDTLIIRMDEGFPWYTYSPVHITVSTQFLNNLTTQHYSGHLQASNLNTSYFNADINLESTGAVALNGKVGLHHLAISGSGNTQIHGINSQFVEVSMRDNAAADLTGIANLQSLNARGKGSLRLYWVDSDTDTLTIRQHDETYVELAGVAKTLDLKLYDHARFNGRYLRAKHGYIKTYDNSTADIQLLNTRAVVADNNSTINFYGKPPYKSDFMARNGAILDINDH